MDEIGLAALTTREREALLLLAQGYRVAEIGPRLSVSRSTVETHLKSARRKLGYSSSLLAARAVYGADAPPRNLVTSVSGMEGHGHVADREEPAASEVPVGVRWADGSRVDHVDLLARLFGRRGNRNGLTRLERLVAWLLLTAMVAIGSFASLAIPYFVQALRRH